MYKTGSAPNDRVALCVSPATNSMPDFGLSFPVIPELQVEGWMDDLQFYVLFNSISVISG